MMKKKIFKKSFKNIAKKLFVATIILGLVFSSIGFISSVVEKAQADDSATSVNITNSLPVASATSIDSDASNVTLIENTTKNVVCFATVTDNNNFDDIESVEAKLYKTSTGAGAGDDDNNHYTLTGDTECIPSNGAGLTEDYTCTFAVQFFADPAEWTCQVTPSDSDGAGTADTDTIIIDALTALNVGGINYGNLGLGNNTGSSPITVPVTNTGNNIMDPQVSSAAAMNCTTGTIAVANQEYSNSTFSYGAGTALSGSATTLDLALPKPTSTTPITDNSFWGIAIPASGVAGSCAGTNVFSPTVGS